MTARKLTKAEVAGLRELFGQGPDGARELIRRIDEGSAPLPPDVSTDTLEVYEKIAQAADDGKDRIGTQELRLRAIRKLLGRMP